MTLRKIIKILQDLDDRCKKGKYRAKYEKVRLFMTNGAILTFTDEKKKGRKPK